MFTENIHMAIRNILQNKMRSFLTVLGMIIGVASIIALMTIVTDLQVSIMNQFNELGANTLMVTAGGNALKSGVTDSELSEIASIEGVTGVAPEVTTSATVVVNQAVVKKVTVEGESEIYFQRESNLLQRGRAILKSDIENETNVCVINQDFADENFAGIDPVGQSIKLNGISYEIIGVANDSSGVASSMQGSHQTVIIPYKNALKLNQTDAITSFNVYFSSDVNSEELIDEIEAKLDSFFNYKENSYTVINIQSMLDMMSSVQSMMKGLLAGVASISLLVGGIGIMNMMLVSVTERTVEIGLRKALGARPFDIQMQFLLEAIILSLIGGAIGMIFGLAIAKIAAVLIEMDFILSESAILLGVGFSAAVGIIFGWAPARKASRLSPIDALRSN